MNDEKKRSSDDELDDILGKLAQSTHPHTEDTPLHHVSVHDGSLLPPRSKPYDSIIAETSKTTQMHGSTNGKGGVGNPSEQPQKQAEGHDNTSAATHAQTHPTVAVPSPSTAARTHFSHPLINGGESQPTLEESIRHSAESGAVLHHTPARNMTENASAESNNSATPSANSMPLQPRQLPKESATTLPKAQNPIPQQNLQSTERTSASKIVNPAEKYNSGNAHEIGKNNALHERDTGDDLVVCDDTDEKTRFRDTAVSGILKMLIYVVVVITVALYASFFIITAGNDIFALKKGELVEATVTIPENASVNDIARILKQNGIINSTEVFEYYTEFKDFKHKKSAEEELEKEEKAKNDAEKAELNAQNPTASPSAEEAAAESNESTVTALINKVFSYAAGFAKYLKSGSKFECNPGEYVLNSNMTYDGIISTLTEIRKDRTVIKVTIPEGFTTDEILELFEKSGLEAKRSDFLDAINNYEYDYEFVRQLSGMGVSKNRTYRLEGYLFPDTYEFFNDESAISIVDKMLSNFNSKFDASYFERAASLGYTVDDIVILASIIEKEAKLPTEQPIISSVFHNRLTSGSPSRLESCATVQYVYQLEYGERKTRIIDSDTNVDHPYNTYLHNGLPPGAIANPGLNAIIAALYPEETPYKYFVATKDGSSLFAETYEEHLENKAKAEKGFTQQ